MRIKNKIIIAALIAVLSFIALIKINHHNSIKNIEFKTINGSILDLQSLKGKPVLISFWSTDCKSCIEEIPHLIELHQKYTKHGFRIIAVAMEYTPPNQVVTMSEAKQLPYSIVLDPDAAIAHHFGDIRLTPTTFLINPAGEIEKKIVGSFNQHEIMQKLDTWLIP